MEPKVTMAKTEFTVEDFNIGALLAPCIHPSASASEIGKHTDKHLADLCNAKLAEIKKAWLEELLRDAPIVYGYKVRGWIMEENSSDSLDTHQARLVCIEPLDKCE